MHNKKRGELVSRVFVHVILLIIAILILVFGYKSIKGIGNRADQASFTEFQARLSTDIKSLTGDSGSVNIKKYTLPSGFNEICFADLDEYDPLYPPEHPLIRNSLESGTEKNVFLIGGPNFESFYINGLQLYFFPFICTKTKGRKIELRMEGTLKKTLVKTPASREECQAINALGSCIYVDLILGPGSKAECCNYNYCCG